MTQIPSSAGAVPMKTWRSIQRASALVRSGTCDFEYFWDGGSGYSARNPVLFFRLPPKAKCPRGFNACSPGSRVCLKSYPITRAAFVQSSTGAECVSLALQFVPRNSRLTRGGVGRDALAHLSIGFSVLFGNSCLHGLQQKHFVNFAFSEKRLLRPPWHHHIFVRVPYLRNFNIFLWDVLRPFAPVE